MAEAKERSWLPDFLYRDGKFESGVAMFADESGRITRFADGKVTLPAHSGFLIEPLPGFVNCHSHTFQRVIRARTEYRRRR